MKISTKLVGTVMLVVLAVFALLSWFLQSGARQALMAQATDSLVALRTTRAQFVQTYFEKTRGEVLVASQSNMIKEMIREMPLAVQRLPHQVPDVMNGQARQAMQSFYTSQVISRMQQAGLAWTGTDDYLVLPQPDLLLQDVYIAQNPFPIGEKQRLKGAIRYTDSLNSRGRRKGS